MTLTEFLLARIAEDEAVAQAATPGPWDWSGAGDCSLYAGDDPGDGIAHASWETDDQSPANFFHIARHDPARILAECEAKRRIVGRHDVVDIEGNCAFCIEPAPCEHLRALALPYAEHPDYDEEWKP